MNTYKKLKNNRVWLQEFLYSSNKFIVFLIIIGQSLFIHDGIIKNDYFERLTFKNVKIVSYFFYCLCVKRWWILMDWLWLCWRNKRIFFCVKENIGRLFLISVLEIFDMIKIKISIKKTIIIIAPS